MTDAQQSSAAPQRIAFTREQIHEIKAIAQATALATIRNTSRFGTADPYRLDSATPASKA